jgi:hypothetical protein
MEHYIRKSEVVDVTLEEGIILRPIRVTEYRDQVMQQEVKQGIFRKKVKVNVPVKVKFQGYELILRDPISGDKYKLAWSNDESLNNKESYVFPQEFSRYFTVVTIKGRPFIKRLPYVAVATHIANQTATYIKPYQNFKLATKCYEEILNTLNVDHKEFIKL